VDRGLLIRIAIFTFVFIFEYVKVTFVTRFAYIAIFYGLSDGTAGFVAMGAVVKTTVG
jgi:hypothetical protein